MQEAERARKRELYDIKKNVMEKEEKEAFLAEKARKMRVHRKKKRNDL